MHRPALFAVNCSPFTIHYSLFTVSLPVPNVNKKLLTDFGNRIRHLRTARGLSQEQLAELTGFHRIYILIIERIT